MKHNKIINNSGYRGLLGLKYENNIKDELEMIKETIINIFRERLVKKLKALLKKLVYQLKYH